jgi:hypothetical protein
MVARSGVVLLASMTDILANPVEICFGSFTVTSTTLAAATSPTAFVEAPTTPDAAPSSSKKSKGDHLKVCSSSSPRATT